MKYSMVQGNERRLTAKNLGQTARKTVWTDKELVDMLYLIDTQIGYQDGYTDSDYNLVSEALMRQWLNLKNTASRRGLVENDL